MSAKEKDPPEPVIIDLPDTVDIESVNKAEIVVIQLAAQRRLSSQEALRFSRMLDHRRRAIADRGFEERMERVEERLKEGDQS